MKLSRRPCTTCKDDTLHTGLKCNVCGTMQPDNRLTRDAKMKARFTRYVKKYGHVVGANKLHHEYLADQRAGQAQKPLTPHHLPPVGGASAATFGRGRITMGFRR